MLCFKWRVRGMNRQELIIMLTVLVVGVCIIVLILLNGL